MVMLPADTKVQINNDIIMSVNAILSSKVNQIEHIKLLTNVMIFEQAMAITKEQYEKRRTAKERWYQEYQG